MILTSTHAAFSRIEILHCCMRAVSDLMIPEKDLHIVNRDSLATLIGFLTSELVVASQCVHNQITEDQDDDPSSPCPCK